MYSRILVPIDGSDCANAGLREVARIANQQARQVLLIHVIESFRWNEEFPAGTIGAIMQDSPCKDGGDILQLAKEILLKSGIACEVILAESHGQSTAQVIVAHASRWNAELIVMGTHGRKRVSRMLLGSDAAEVISAASAPVLLVRHSTTN